MTFPLLSSIRHSAMITPVSPLRTKAVEPVLKFQAPASGIEIFWLRLQYLEAFGSGSGSRTVWSKKSEKTLYYLYTSFAPQTISVDPEPKFQASVPPSKSFWLRLQPSKIASVPAPQPCCVIGSFILALVVGQFIVRLKLFSKGNCPLDWNSNPVFYTNSLLQKNFSPIQIIFQKIFNCIGQLRL